MNRYVITLKSTRPNFLMPMLYDTKETLITTDLHTFNEAEQLADKLNELCPLDSDSYVVHRLM